MNRSQEIRDQHLEDTLNQLEIIRRSDFLCDVLIFCEGATFLAHGCILQASSSVLLKEISNGEVENGKKCVYIRNLSGQEVELALQFIYTGKLAIKLSNFEQVLRTAFILELHFLKETCCTLLRRVLSPSNAIQYFKMAHTLSKELSALVQTFICYNFSLVMDTSDFVDLRMEHMEAILGDKRLVLRNQNGGFLTGPPFEAMLINSVKKWTTRRKFRDIVSQRLRSLCVQKRHDRPNCELKTYSEPSPTVCIITQCKPFGSFPDRFDPHLRYNQYMSTFVSTSTDNCPAMWTIKSMIVYVNPTSSTTPDIIAGVDLLYVELWGDTEKWHLCDLERDGVDSVFRIDLDPDERIIAIRACHTSLLHGLTFITNQDREFGPYGTPENHSTLRGSQSVSFASIQFDSDHPSAFYLCGFNYTIVQCSGRNVWSQVKMECACLKAKQFYQDFSQVMDAPDLARFYTMDQYTSDQERQMIQTIIQR